MVYHLGWEMEEKKVKPRQTQLFVELNEEEKKIWSYLKEKDQELIDVIALDCNIPVFKLASILLNMELKGVMRPLPGKQFQVV